jgi:hypothetical protein
VLKPALEALPRPVDDKLWLASSGGKLGILDFKGKWMLSPELEDLQAFRENGLAWAKKDGIWGQVDRNGAWILQPTFQDVGLYAASGLAPAYLDGHFTVVDQKGEIVARAGKACGQNVVVGSDGKVSFPKDPKLKDCQPEG